MNQSEGRKTKKEQQILVAENELCPNCGEYTLTMKTTIEGVLIYENCSNCGYECPRK